MFDRIRKLYRSREIQAALKRQIPQEEGYLTLIDDDEKEYEVKESDLLATFYIYRESYPNILQRDGRRYKHLKLPTPVAIWFARIVSNDLPALMYVDLDYFSTIALYQRLHRLQIDRNEAWLEALLRSRIASDPWKGLAKAWGPPYVDMDLAELIIRRFPSYQHISFVADGYFAAENLTSEKLCSYPFGCKIIHRTGTSVQELDVPPLFAFALAITRVRTADPQLDEEAANGDRDALRSLLMCIAREFSRAWSIIQRKGKYASWMALYTVH